MKKAPKHVKIGLLGILVSSCFFFSALSFEDFFNQGGPYTWLGFSIPLSLLCGSACAGYLVGGTKKSALVGALCFIAFMSMIVVIGLIGFYSK